MKELSSIGFLLQHLHRGCHRAQRYKLKDSRGLASGSGTHLCRNLVTMAASNHLYLEVTRNLLGVFMPTNNLTLKVSSAAAKIKKEITVTEVPVPIKKDDESESIAVKATREHDHENSTVTVMKEGGHEITYSTVWREDCQEEIARHLYMEELQQPSRDAIKKVLDDLVNVYYPKV